MTFCCRMSASPNAFSHIPSAKRAAFALLLKEQSISKNAIIGR